MSHTLAAAIPFEGSLSPEDEARVFGRMRYRIFATLLRQTLSQSRFRVTLVVALSGLLWGGMFWMFVDGFLFLKTTITDPDMHFRTLSALFGTFFAALTIMLVFSSGVILYGSLFCSQEIKYLLTLPVRAERLFLHKAQEALLISSWGLVLLGSPMLLAYGVAESAPWYYYLLWLPYLVTFVYIPVSIGGISCLLIVRYFPAGRKTVLMCLAGALAAGAAWMTWSLLQGPDADLLTPGWFQEMLARMQFSEQRLLPSWWLSTGLLAAAIPEKWPDGTMFLTLLISNALFFRQLAIWAAGRMYRDSYSGLCGRTSRRRRTHAGRIDRILGRLIGAVHGPSGLLIVKDLRLFRRDPLQWSQFLVFLGLLTLYFINVRRFTYDTYYVGWVNMVSFLNLAVVGLLLSTFTTRFIFPMISLEGRRFWLLGLSAVPRDAILWSKFAFSVGGTLVPCCLLVFLSDTMLGVSSLALTSHQLTCIVLCFGLSGIAVGLGARLPNFREQSPSRIAAGFGGTLTLVVSTLFILVVVLLTALPSHFYLAAQNDLISAAFEQQARLRWWVSAWLAAGSAASILLGLFATILPLYIGLRAFRKMEF